MTIDRKNLLIQDTPWGRIGIDMQTGMVYTSSEFSYAALNGMGETEPEEVPEEKVGSWKEAGTVDKWYNTLFGGETAISNAGKSVANSFSAALDSGKLNLWGQNRFVDTGGDPSMKKSLPVPVIIGAMALLGLTIVLMSKGKKDKE